MIREYNNADRAKLIEIINKGYLIDEKDVVSFIDSNEKKLVVYDEAGIRGFAYLKESDKETKRWDIKIYVEPESRRRGIGAALYDEVKAHLEEMAPNLLITEARVDRDDPGFFYKKLGYKKWFACHELYYKGTNQPEVDIKFVPYEDKYYEQYAKLIQDCFYELRKENDIQPYACPINEEDRTNTLKIREYIYIVLDNENIMAAVLIKEGEIDRLVVSPAYQGRGCGRKITQFAINKALEQGISPIKLSALVWNAKAVKLYRSMGFEIVQTIQYYRQFGGM